MSNEISCIDLCDIGSQTVVTVAVWNSYEISLISLSTLNLLDTVRLETNYLIRSVALATFQDAVSCLFAGLGDGTLISYNINCSTWKLITSTKKTVTLGYRPIRMSTFHTKGVMNVFVLSDRPTVISRSNDRLVYSNVNFKVNAFYPL